ncbi:hypothetical protein GH733_007815 [Mirounga leonina]|nr:hypothetical protein GH733_007815 [Mirounga leonina]
MKLLSFLEGNLASRSNRKCSRRCKNGWHGAISGHTWVWFWLLRILQVIPISSTKSGQLQKWESTQSHGMSGKQLSELAFQPQGKMWLWL